MIDDAANKTGVSAVIASYNEEDRIRTSLEALTASPILDEIIVVDDGSRTDVTEKTVKEFDGAIYLKNERNMGKGYSMNRGVRAAKYPVIFFCDADLKGLTPEIVEAIVRPVVNGEYDMFIGIRNNMMQKTIRAFALNSGERALKKHIWEQLPDYYKNGFRIEIGLNYFVKYHGKGYGYKKFDYYQTLKEVKWGFVKGHLNRWKLYYEVGIAWLRAALYDRFRKFD